MPKPRNWMDYANTLDTARTDVAAKMQTLHALEIEQQGLAPGPGYYEANQQLQARIETARRDHGLAEARLQQVKNGTQTSLL